MKTEVLPAAAAFYQAVNDHHRDIHPTDYFVEFAVEVAERSTISAQALLDADIVSLLSSSQCRVRPKVNFLTRFQKAVKSETFSWHLDETLLDDVGNPPSVYCTS